MWQASRMQRLDGANHSSAVWLGLPHTCMSGLARRTLNDPDAFVIPQFWASDDHTAWWDLKYLHAFLKRSGWEELKRRRWFKKFSKQADSVDGLPHRESPAGLCEHTSHTLGLVTFLWTSADTCRHILMARACVSFMRRMIYKATQPVADYYKHVTFDNNITCRVYNGGQMVGLTSLLTRHLATLRMLRSMWAEMLYDGILDGEFDRDTHSVMDVATFFMKILRVRREKKKRISNALRYLADRVRFRMLPWIAGAVESYVLRVYSGDNPLTSLAPPAIVSGNGFLRQYTTVSAEAAWDVMAKARASGADLVQALRLKDDAPDLGCSSSRAEAWMQKKQLMYDARVHLAFPHMRHWNLVADPGTHSYKDIMPSVLYGWQVNMACFPPFQHLLPGKAVTIYDAELEEDLAPLAAERKLERVATYRQLQGYSMKISCITKGVLSLADFTMPQSCCLDPVQRDEFRFTVDQGNIRLAFIKNKVTGETRAVLPPDVEDILTLILGLDEGSIGTAGVAGGSFKMKAMLWAKFDKIHRIIRDMKLGENDCCGKVFAKAKLWSAYLYGLNNRPFGSGSNHTLKERLLNIFQLSETVDSPHFRRYLTSIAKDFGMPCDSREDQEEVFKEVLDMNRWPRTVAMCGGCVGMQRSETSRGAAQ